MPRDEAGVTSRRLATTLGLYASIVLWLNGLTAHARAMFESIGGWWPLLNGYGGFFPAAFPERMRLAERLPDAVALEEFRRATGVAYVLVRGDMPAARGAAWEALAKRGAGAGLRFVTRDGATLLFAVAEQPEAAAGR